MSSGFFPWGLSVLTFPSSGGTTPPPAIPIDSSLPIRERILQHVALSLRLIQSVRAEAVARAAPGASFAAAGPYTGAVTRRYRVEVVVAGASGTAQVDVTDDSPDELRSLWPDQDEADTGYLDDGPSGQVVTSGSAITLGAGLYGVTFTLTFDGSLSVGEAWYVHVGPFQSSVELVTRLNDERPGGGCWIEIQGPVQASRPGPLPLQRNDLELVLQCYVARVPSPETAVEKLLSDVTEALRLDPTRDALAVNTLPLGDQCVVLSDAKRRSWVDLRVQIHYRHRDNDPRSL